MSFTGDGANLAGVTTDAELSAHGGDASAHHTPTIDTDTDTTCLDAGVACNFAASASEGGAATTGDSATGFFSTGQIEEPRIDDAIARDSEITSTILVELCSLNVLRYLDQGDGTVLDCNTGLLWLKDASCADLAGTDAVGAGNWATAQSAAAALVSGTCGLTDGSVAGDWRQPTISELCSAGAVAGICPAANASDSLINSSVGPPTVVNAQGGGVWLEGDAFVGVQSFGYWSATEAGAGDAWFVLLNSGNVFSFTKNSTQPQLLRVAGSRRTMMGSLDL